MVTVNKRIAVTPFPTVDTKTTVVKGGMVVIKQRAELTRLVAVYGAEYFEGSQVRVVQPGQGVYVNGDLCKHQLARDIFETEPGKPFILISSDMLVAVDVVG
jgi:hypothetical protein